MVCARNVCQGQLLILCKVSNLKLAPGKGKINRIYDGVEAETRKSQASFQIFQVSSEALHYLFIYKTKYTQN